MPRAPAPRVGDQCLDDEALALLLDGGLDADEDRAVRGHLDACDECRRLFADAARSTSGTRRARLKKGDVVAGKYRIERELGEGGMGIVLAARHLELASLVALKVLRPELGDDADAMKRFAREAKAAAALRSENAVHIHDVGKLEDGTPYMVMEYLEGADLATKLEENGPLPVEDAVRYVLQACDALAEAHELGIVHRDLKPHNLFVTTERSGRVVVKVLDFGLAKAIDTQSKHDFDQESSMTGTNVMLGSPFFMSPEQAGSGRKVDARSDIWSLGATLYHLVSGMPPFVAPTIHVLCARILREDFRPIRTKRPEAPPELEVVLRRCMSRDPDARYASVGELAKALQHVLVAPAPTGDVTIDREQIEETFTKPIAMPQPHRTATSVAPEPPPVVVVPTPQEMQRIATMPLPPPGAVDTLPMAPPPPPPPKPAPRANVQRTMLIAFGAAFVIATVVGGVVIHSQRQVEIAPIASAATTATPAVSTSAAPPVASSVASVASSATIPEKPKHEEKPRTKPRLPATSTRPTTSSQNIYDHP